MTPRLFALTLLILVAASRCGATARAQGTDDALMLARTCAHEAGWESPADCAAIWQVWLAGAEREGVSPASFARRYSPRLHSGRVVRAWAASLRADGRRPRSWPASLSWAHYRARWLGVLAACESIVSGTTPSPCAERPSDWGSRSDMERARMQGRRFRVVDCGDTRNTFAIRGER